MKRTIALIGLLTFGLGCNEQRLPVTNQTTLNGQTKVDGAADDSWTITGEVVDEDAKPLRPLRFGRPTESTGMKLVKCHLTTLAV